MNRKVFYGAFLFVLLATCINSRSLGDSSIDVENNNSYDKGPTLMHILQSILEDPEYLALSDHEQLAVLEVIYSLLESSFRQRKSKSYIG
jgi:hypothetical protein